MSQVFDFTGAASPEKIRLRVVPRGDEMGDFWPETFRRHAADEDAAVDPSNAPKRVLSEVAVLFSVVALLVLAVTFFIPGP